MDDIYPENPERVALVEAAAEALSEIIQRPLHVDPAEDSWFPVRIPDWRVVFAAAPYHRPVHPRGVGALADWFERALPAPPSSMRRIAILDYASRATAERLHQHHVCFIDASGNAYLEADGCVVFVLGRKQKPRVAAPRQNRAFSRSGLQVVFGLLADPSLANATYRIIADTIGVSHGTVGAAMESLKAMGYLEEAGTRRLLKRRAELRTRWAAGYAETLRPHLLHSRFRFTEPSQASERVRALPPALGLWSGEPGADLLTGYLKPGSYTLFSTAPASDLARALGVVRDEAGPLDVLRPFWSSSWGHATSREHPRVAHPLLVWADLLATGDARSQDVAAMVLTIVEAAYASTGDREPSVGAPENEAS